MKTQILFKNQQQAKPFIVSLLSHGFILNIFHIIQLIFSLVLQVPAVLSIPLEMKT